MTEITLADYDTVNHLGANINVTGNGEGDTIIGNDGNDVIDPGDASGPSTLTGGAGADTFVYGNGYGAVTITNFDQGSGSFSQGEGDVINLTNDSSVGNFYQLHADAAQNGANNTVITFAPGDTLTLDNVTPAQLQNSDFIFAPLTAGPATLSGGVEGATAATLSAIFSAADLNAPATDFSGTINWGDGNTTAFDSSAVSGGNGSFTVSGSHVYAEEGDYTATVTIDDTSGHTKTETATTAVADAALTASGTIISATEGASTGPTTVATFTDADPNAVR